MNRYISTTKHNIFTDIRGKGLLVGAALIEPWHGKARDFLNAAIKEGVMVLVAGPNVIRIAPSLVMPDDEIKLAMDKFNTGQKNVEKALAACNFSSPTER